MENETAENVQDNSASEESRQQEQTKVPSEEAHDDGKSTPNESEYDSAGSYSDDQEQGKVRSRGSDGEVSDSEGSVTLERESGDGQESAPAKKVDDDEDKKNPQYIPKRGTFYEHDDRTDDVENQEEAEVEKDKEPKKKVWQDKKERWNHDKFNDQDQAPKSKAELVAIYGYDIRNEDGPPRARRRRRYGRGPNKYTRNWEDEDAYNKPPVTRTKKPPPRRSARGEEFPPLIGSNTSENWEENNSTIEGDQNGGGNRSESRELSDRSEQQQYQGETNGNMRNASSSHVHENAARITSATSYQEHVHKPQQQYQQQQRVGSGRVVKPKREIKDSDYKGFTTKTRQGRNIKTDQKIVPKTQKREDFIETQNFTNKNSIAEIEKDMNKMSMQDGGGYKGGKHGGQRQGSVPPRLQSEQKGSKRYSSMRQRSLPESATPPFNQHSNYYTNDYNQQGQVPPQGIIHQNTQIHPSTNTQVPQIAPPPLPPIPQVPVTAPPILQAAPQFAPPFQAPPAFLQPGVPPPQFIPQQTPPIINYVPSQPQFPQGYQGYQQQFNTVTQPPELYQPQTGITYYSTDQQIAQRAVPQKRPKAAIPIVAPPSLDHKGKISKDDVETEMSGEQQRSSENILQPESSGVAVHQ